MLPSHRNQSIDLQHKSINQFLCDKEHWSLMGYGLKLMNHGISNDIAPHFSTMQNLEILKKR